MKPPKKKHKKINIHRTKIKLVYQDQKIAIASSTEKFNARNMEAKKTKAPAKKKKSKLQKREKLKTKVKHIK